MDFLQSILSLQNVSLRYWTNKDAGRSNQSILSTRCWEKKTHFNVLGLLEWLTCAPRWHGGKEPACNAKDTRKQVRSLGWEDALEKEIATHSSILAWRTPWTEEPESFPITPSSHCLLRADIQCVRQSGYNSGRQVWSSPYGTYRLQGVPNGHINDCYTEDWNNSSKGKHTVLLRNITQWAE